MEMDERKFYEALMEYFKRREKDCTALDKEMIQIITSRLVQLVSTLRSEPLYRKDKKVHLGHTFGPFGFKVEGFN
jgi:hypothetical protein